jgi:thiamine phosphate synthase YjbQ (UPF0047 family)
LVAIKLFKGYWEAVLLSEFSGRRHRFLLF